MIENSNSLNSFDFFGDCIGFGATMGKSGRYVQSDMQFVQQVQDNIRDFPHGENKQHTIPDYINMKIFARFFVDDQPGESNNRM